MLDKVYLNKISGLFAENRLLKFTVLVIGVAMIYFAAKVESAVNSHKVIIVPAGLSVEVEIDGNYLPDSYIDTMATYVMSLTTNYTPVSARGQFDRLLKLYAPDQFANARKIFYDLASAIEVSKNTSAFYIAGISVDRKKGQIEVRGTRKQFSESTSLSDQNKVYFIDFTVANGRFMITKFSEMVDRS
jgi:conjugal transfer pilus assembly protein TraE